MPIDKIICVGKNYLDHALELGDAVPAQPVLFLKPPSVLKQASAWGETVSLCFPNGDASVQPECEIAIQIAQDGFCFTPDEAKHAIKAVTLGLDMTLRMRQAELKKNGHPWTTAKVFVDAAVLGPWIPKHEFETYMETTFQLFIDDTCCQSAKGQEMRMLPEALLVYVSQFFPLKAGDIVFTGTPAGVVSISSSSVVQLVWGKYTYQAAWK